MVDNQTLVFNTTEKIATLHRGLLKNVSVIFEFKNVPTVKVENGYYEVMQKSEGSSLAVVPVLRVPIANTNMLIQK
jgi:hypothetical protein